MSWTWPSSTITKVVIFSFIFRNVLVGGYTLGICSRSSHRDIGIRHLLTSNQGSNHIGPRLPVMGVCAMIDARTEVEFNVVMML
jgi:hypothetical protein